MKTSRHWEEDKAEDELRKTTERVTQFGCAVGLDTSSSRGGVDGGGTKEEERESGGMREFLFFILFHISNYVSSCNWMEAKKK